MGSETTRGRDLGTGTREISESTNDGPLDVRIVRLWTQDSGVLMVRAWVFLRVTTLKLHGVCGRGGVGGSK